MANNISEVMAQAVDRLVKKEINQAPYDKTYSGIISDILFEPDTKLDNEKFGQYKIRYGTGTEKIIKLNDGLVHEVGERVKVYVPENDRNRMFIEPTIKSTTPYKIVYDDENTKFSIDEEGKAMINAVVIKVDDISLKASEIIPISLIERIKL